MFNLFRGKNAKSAIHTAVGGFLHEEKKRHKNAVDFLQMMAGVTVYVAEEVWGAADPEVKISDTVRFDMATQSFFYKTDGNEMNVQALKGQPFWQSVQQIMVFGQDLLDDIKEREEGRKQLVSNIADLTQQMNESSIVIPRVKMFRV
ncbi:hypothetical protein HNR77_002521 [Paenibacillus sp. JGP012]|uniref:hypothetical protein n=1 Tax=Paenibacillus sp. JGP012 TaxID=2735914 RepID=UPI00161BF08F|nr:hypothetical protein [Paenibacillus sp. JGP012]MBB6021426.1 hypothetical protein [Paenibacillus sp. JGP012]